MRGHPAIRRARREFDRDGTNEPLRSVGRTEDRFRFGGSFWGPRCAGPRQFHSSRLEIGGRNTAQLLAARAGDEAQRSTVQRRARSRLLESDIRFSRVSTRRISCRSAARWEVSGPKRALRCLPHLFLASRSIRRNRPGCACPGPTFRPSSSELPRKAASPTCRPISIAATPATICRDHGDLLANLVRWARATRFRSLSTGRADRLPSLPQHNRVILHLVNLTKCGHLLRPSMSLSAAWVPER